MKKMTNKQVENGPVDLAKKVGGEMVHSHRTLSIVASMFSAAYSFLVINAIKLGKVAN